jgi:hypothetical protein
MKRTVRRILAIVISLSNPLWSTAQQKPIMLHNQRELFADDYLLEKLDKIEIRQGVPVSGGVALKFNEPWEGAFAGAYISIINDGTRFRMYYRGQGAGNGANGEVTCYAESPDGISWKKPDLNLLETQGTRHNNVVMKGSPQQSSHNLSVIYDNRPGVPATQRYKAVGGVASSLRSARGLYRYISADGINWDRLKTDTTALFRDGYGMDSQNVLAWLPSENTYAIYLRKWTGDKPGDIKLLKGVRTIARSVSKDFVNWSEPVAMSFGNTPLENLYTNATQPYFRAPQILIAMPFRFSPDSRILTDDEMKANGIDISMWKGVSDAVLLTSRGGNAYERKFMESFVRPGLDQRNWAARSTIPALGIVPTGENEMSFFVTRAYGTKDSYLERMTLRKDGFASLHAGFTEGNAITKPLILKGNNFSINYSTSSAGHVRIALLDEYGVEIPGFGALDAEKITGDKIDAKVKWKSGKTIKELGNKKVRIKFIVKDADIYSLNVSDL